jgi:hypothetical protein
MLIIILLVLNVMLIGLGMGIPILNIIFALPLGYQLSKGKTGEVRSRLKEMYKMGLIFSLSSIVVLIVIWLPQIKWLIDPSLNIANFGHPFWLYDPLISFIGWIILMVLVAPLLQLLSYIFGGVLAILYT